MAKAMDHRRAWVVMGASFVALMIESGLRPSLSIYFLYFLESFNCTQSAAATVFALLNATTLMSGPLVGVFYKAFGARLAVMLGGGIAAVGYGLIAFCTTIYQVIGLGVVIGVGSGMIRTSAVSVQPEYFLKYRNLAMGFVCVGPGVGIFVFPQVIKYFIGLYSWRGSMAVIAALMLQCVVMGALLRPRKVPSKKAISQQHTASLSDYCAVTLWKNPIFVLQGSGVALAAGCVFIYSTLNVTLMQQHGLSETVAVFTFSLHGIMSLIGRLVGTIVVQLQFINITVFIAICYATAQIPMFAGVFCYSQTTFSIQNAITGIGNGMFPVALAPFLVSIGGVENLPMALGYTNLFNGIGGMIILKFGGELADRYGLNYAFYLAGVVGISSVIIHIVIVLMLPLHGRWKTVRDQKATLEEESSPTLSTIASTTSQSDHPV